ncbi:DNA mismatch repair protein MutS [Synechococcus sp. RSCCF101]|nr:DNA mismatch repair protein MutS [Synechococcus sp. RSCCF101]
MLLQDGPRLAPGHPLLLVVHGREGGHVPEGIERFASDLAGRRRAPVRVQALTADVVEDGARHPCLWLAPLLLLPGSHVRSDIPAIARRLQRDGHGVRRLPFLGAWPELLRMMREWVERERANGRRTVLVHHPLRPGLARRHLTTLQRRLGAELLPADQLRHYTPAHRSAALPLALAANRMSDSLQHRLRPHPPTGCTTDFEHVFPPLLDDPRCRTLLLRLLSALP